MGEIGQLNAVETILPGILAYYSISGVDFISGKKNKQQIQILTLDSFGKSLLIDGKLSSCTSDEFIYHECFTHPALLSHENPKSVLILGGGTGALSREALRHRSVERVVLVDFDDNLVESIKTHLPSYYRGSFENQKLTVVIKDARDYLQNSNDNFDIILLDLPDPSISELSSTFYNEDFYKLVANKLNAGGIIVTQSCTASVVEPSSCISIFKEVKKVFKHVKLYTAHVPCYLTHQSYIIASNSLDVTNIPVDNIDNKIEQRITATHETGADSNAVGGVPLECYDQDTHILMFHLPKFLQSQIDALSS